MSDSDTKKNDELKKKDPVRWGEATAFAWRHWRRYPRILTGSAVLLIAATLCDTFIPFCSKKIIDSIAAGHAGMAGQEREAFIGFAGFFALAFGHHVLRVSSSFLFFRASARAVPRIAQEALFKVARLSTDWHVNSFAGATVRKITRGMWAFDTFGDTLVLGLIPAAIMLTGITVIQSMQWPSMGLVFGASFLIYILASTWLAVKFVAPVGQRFNETDSALGASLADTITCNAVVKAFGAEAREDAFIGGKIAAFTREFWAVIVRFATTDLAQSLLLTSMQAVIIGYAIWLWTQKAASPGDVTFVMSSCFVLNSYVRDIGSRIRHLQRSVNDMEDVVRFDRMAFGVPDRPDAMPLAAEAGHIVFDDVAFKYANQDNHVYRGFSLDIRPGEKVGLVGHSGSGKSTLVKLLQRLYDVQEGSIRVDGQDIALVTQESLRQAMSIVPQDPTLFHRTLAENIAYGRPEATREEIVRAARLAHAHEFIERLSQGYDTLVGERGVKLSGGERQRVAIARAILADRPILIMDEATSSLDSVSEALIQDALDNLMRGRTTIIVAHRLSTVQKVDRILVFDQGRIVEQGHHADLVLKEGGAYRAFFEKQVAGLLGDADDAQAA